MLRLDPIVQKQRDKCEAYPIWIRGDDPYDDKTIEATAVRIRR